MDFLAQPQTPLLELSTAELVAWLKEHGQPAYRAAQIRKWIFARRAESFAAMSDLPKQLRTDLAAALTFWSTSVAAHRTAADGSEKLLLRLADGQHVECVLLRDDKGHCNICLSSQVGCGMGCVFCASGLSGVARNLTRGEIVEEMLQVQSLLRAGAEGNERGEGRREKGEGRPCGEELGDAYNPHPQPLSRTRARGAKSAAPQRLPSPLSPLPSSATERLSHIVVMGMGEPLANLDNVLAALEVANKELGISARRITISTVGLPKGVRRLADMNCQYHLAVSLHAPDDALRNKIVPANRQVGIAAVLAAADYYFAQTGRRVTYEYVLLAGVNDRPQEARRLVGLLRGRPSLVNLIPFNPVPGLEYRSPAPAAVDEFAAILTRGGLNVEIRRRKGDAIDAACGQLRRSV